MRKKFFASKRKVKKVSPGGLQTQLSNKCTEQYIVHQYMCRHTLLLIGEISIKDEKKILDNREALTPVFLHWTLLLKLAYILSQFQNSRPKKTWKQETVRTQEGKQPCTIIGILPAPAERSHSMGNISTLVTLCEWNPPVIRSQRAKNVELW